MTIIGNEVRDCLSVGIYADTARSVRIEGNIIRASDQTYQRNGHLMDGVLMGAEAYYMTVPDFGAEDIVIANNLDPRRPQRHRLVDRPATARVRHLPAAQSSGTSSGAAPAERHHVLRGSAAVPRQRGVLTDNILYKGAGSQPRTRRPGPGADHHEQRFSGRRTLGRERSSNIAVDPQLTGRPRHAAPTPSGRAPPPCRHAGRPSPPCRWTSPARRAAPPTPRWVRSNDVPPHVTSRPRQAAGSDSACKSADRGRPCARS